MNRRTGSLASVAGISILGLMLSTAGIAHAVKTPTPTLKAAKPVGVNVGKPDNNRPQRVAAKARKVKLSAAPTTDTPDTRPQRRKASREVWQKVSPAEQQKRLEKHLMAGMNARRAQAGLVPLVADSCVKNEAIKMATYARDSGKFGHLYSNCWRFDFNTLHLEVFDSVPQALDKLAETKFGSRNYLYPGYQRVGLAVRVVADGELGKDKIAIAAHYSWGRGILPANTYRIGSLAAPSMRDMQTSKGQPLLGTETVYRGTDKGAVQWSIVRGQAPDDGKRTTAKQVAAGTLPSFTDYVTFTGKETLTSGSLDTKKLGTGRYTMQLWIAGQQDVRKFSIHVF